MTKPVLHFACALLQTHAHIVYTYMYTHIEPPEASNSLSLYLKREFHKALWETKSGGSL